jgi:hypothetical protein
MNVLLRNHSAASLREVKCRPLAGNLETNTQVEAAVSALVEAGIAREEISLVSFQDAMSDAEAAIGQGYFEIAIRASDDEAKLATSILKQNGAANVSAISALGEVKEEAELPMKPEDYRREDNPADDTLPPPLPR